MKTVTIVIAASNISDISKTALLVDGRRWTSLAINDQA
jgi:hypothetical protein